MRLGCYHGDGGGYQFYNSAHFSKEQKSLGFDFNKLDLRNFSVKLKNFNDKITDILKGKF